MPRVSVSRSVSNFIKALWVAMEDKTRLLTAEAVAVGVGVGATVVGAVCLEAKSTEPMTRITTIPTIISHAGSLNFLGGGVGATGAGSPTGPYVGGTSAWGIIGGCGN